MQTTTTTIPSAAPADTNIDALAADITAPAGLPLGEYAALIGMDWGDKSHAFALLARGATVPETGAVEQRAEALLPWLDALGARFAGQRVAVAIEAAKGPLIAALLGCPWLTVYPVHPATSARMRSAFAPSGAKDDTPDALVLLSLLQLHRPRLRALIPDDAATRGLDLLCRARRKAVDARTALTNELLAVLKTVFPQAPDLAGADLAAPLALDLLARWPRLSEIKKARPATLRAFFYAHNVRQPEVVTARLERVEKARALTGDEALLSVGERQIRLLVDQLRALQKHIAGFEAAIAAAFDAHPDAALFATLPGAGAALAPRLLCAFGSDRARFASAAELQRASGIAPVTERSGSRCWIHWRWNAPAFLRQTFVEWAGQTVLRSAWARAFYDAARARGAAHHAVLRALAFKWQRILIRCWHDRRPYDESAYLKALHTRRSPLAAAIENLPKKILAR